MSLFIKICGITCRDDARFAILNGTDAIGFIAYPESPRYIKPEQVAEICHGLTSLDKAIRKVGVFVNADEAEIQAYLAAGIDVIQLHGDESVQCAINLSHFAEIWRAVRPQQETDLLKHRDFPADKFLIDAFHPVQPGGTGCIADWGLARYAVQNLPAPVILAGGLNPKNLNAGVNQVQPYGIDVSSGVELKPGKKDLKKLKSFLILARKLAKEPELS